MLHYVEGDIKKSCADITKVLSSGFHSCISSDHGLKDIIALYKLSNGILKKSQSQ